MPVVYQTKRNNLAKKTSLRVKKERSEGAIKDWEKIQAIGREIPPVPADLSDPQLTPNGEYIARNSYLRKDNKGDIIETPKEMFWRVAHNVASADLFYDSQKQMVKSRKEFYELLANLEFIPNTPTLCNAARPLQQLSGCFVLPIEDTLDSIGKTFWQTMLVHKTGGGTGFSFSKLRPYGAIVQTTGGPSSGAVSFMWMYSDATDRVQQGGFRRGANMGVMNINHPDILRWITVKSTEATISSFNLSVAITNDFMKKVEEDSRFAPQGIKDQEEEIQKIIRQIQTILRNSDFTFGDRVSAFEKEVVKLKDLIEARQPGEGYELISPDTQKVEFRLNARKMFELLARLAWEKGDPGVIFLDRINLDNPTPHIGQIEATNPCVVGSTLVSTERGFLPIEKIVKEKIELKVLTDNRVIGGQGVTLRPHNHLWDNGVKEVWRLETKSGFTLEATPDHKIMTTHGFVPLSKLRMGQDKVLIQSEKGFFNKDKKLPFKVKNVFKGENGRISKLNLPFEWSKELGQVLGFLVGDGWLREGDKDCRVGFTFSSSDQKQLEKIKNILNKWYGKKIKPVKRENGVWHLSYHSKYFVEFFKKLGVKPVNASQKEVPESLFTAPKDTVIGFLQGLFTSDGTVNYRLGQSSYVRLTSKSRKLLQQVQLLLLNLGIPTRIYDRCRPGRKMFPYKDKNGQEKIYLCDGVCFELEISRQPVLRFLEEVGFVDKHREKTKLFSGKKYYQEVYETTVLSIEPIGKEKVYDLTEQETSSFVANGMVISNCGEQPLLPYESCNLGAINLARVVRKNGKAAEIDWEKLRHTVYKAVHFLDNVIDMNKYPLPEIEKLTKRNRKIGLGVMGWANLLVSLGIPYNSQEAYDLAGKLMNFIHQEARKKSIIIASERGIFPNFKGSIYDKESPYFKGEDLRLRNAAITTVAPTGTTSMLADVNSGIEPFFALWFKKNIVTGDQVETLNPQFVEIAKSLGFWSDDLLERVKENKGSVKGLFQVPEDVQKLFPIAGDLSHRDHVLIQAAFQNSGVDSAISKTINMSTNAPVEAVIEAYKLAFELGCKGVTIYRDRSRKKQILESSTEPEEEKTLVKRPRPAVVAGRTHRVETPVGTAFVHVTRDDKGNIFEIFIGVGKAGSDISADAEALGRLISLTLRLVPSTYAPEVVDHVINQLSGIGGRASLGMGPNRVRSLADAIAKVLSSERKFEQGLEKKTSEDGETNVLTPNFPESGHDLPTNEIRKTEVQLVLGADLCPDCGNITLVAEEGCMKCLLCGYSRC